MKPIECWGLMDKRGSVGDLISTADYIYERKWDAIQHADEGERPVRLYIVPSDEVDLRDTARMTMECWAIQRPDGSLFMYYFARPPELYVSRDAVDMHLSQVYDPTLDTSQGYKPVRVKVTIEMLSDKEAPQ